MSRLSPIEEILARTAFAAQGAERLERANGNKSHNTYLALTALPAQEQAGEGHGRLLEGVPVSLKDCFDLAGFITTCGSRYYARHRSPALADSAVAGALKAAGAAIIGKTHMHQLAYGITGENSEYGDCLQPEDAGALTGGSSSGAAASVQEGSALAAIGTDTGGSIRVPSALCGLAGYRCSHGLTDWRGAHHLAPSFDTAGWIFRDLRDAPRLARALWGVGAAPVDGRVRIGCAGAAMLEDCEPAVLASYERWRERLAAHGAVFVELELDFWEEAFAMFAPIQAHEASQIHAGLYEHFEPAIAARLRWGASLGGAEVEHWRERRREFMRRTGELFAKCDFILAPATPIARLVAGGDHSTARQTILRYTTPASVAGLPVAALPGGRGGGMQLMAAHGGDALLLGYAALLGDLLAAE